MSHVAEFWRCPQCGHSNELNYCPACGAARHGEAALAAVAPAEAEFTAGSTHPEFDDWWKQFGLRLTTDPRMSSLRMMAFTAWAVAWDKSRAETQQLERAVAHPYGTKEAGNVPSPSIENTPRALPLPAGGETPETQVTRLEVIGPSGRLLTLRPTTIELSYQDEGRTLKVFTSTEQVKAGETPLQDGWQDITTAPKDRPFLGWHKTWTTPEPCEWTGHRFQSHSERLALKLQGYWTSYPATYWQPLPAPPRVASPTQEPA
jgi:hypothetical protein